MSSISQRVLAGLLEERTGQQLANSRHPRVEAVLKPLMRERQITTLDQLAGLVAMGRDAALADEVVEMLLNHETLFFRELATFDLLIKGALPKLVASRPSASKRLRIWCAGCSTGQEAYSLAIGFAEQQDRWAGWTIEIIGTDVSPVAIDRARQGLYSQFEIQRGLGIKQVLNWFECENEQWRARPELRTRVSFQVHNLLVSPPLGGRFDAILCRNVLLYFSAERRQAVYDRLAGALAAGGVLMLGAAETILGQTQKFEPHSDCRGLYRVRAEAPLGETRQLSA